MSRVIDEYVFNNLSLNLKTLYIFDLCIEIGKNGSCQEKSIGMISFKLIRFLEKYLTKFPLKNRPLSFKRERSPSESEFTSQPMVRFFCLLHFKIRRSKKE